MIKNFQTHKNLELIYKSPDSMTNPTGAVPSLKIDGLSGILAEYVIEADLHLNTVPKKDASLNIQINNDGNDGNYSSIEHVYGLSLGKIVHTVVHKPTGSHGGLFLTRTHNRVQSNVNAVVKVYSSPFYPKIRLETINSNMIISNPGRWIQQDVSSIYNSPISEIKTLHFYTSPAANFYGTIKIYKKTDED
jgi:hypothetical protein